MIIDVRLIAEKLGLQQGINGNYHCFRPERHTHADADASLSINEKYFNCFGCGVKGNGIELIKLVLKLDTSEAFKWLEQNFVKY